MQRDDLASEQADLASAEAARNGSQPYTDVSPWYQSYRQHGIVLPVWRIHRNIGMGGDQLIAALTDDRTEQDQGDEIRATESEVYKELIDEVETMEASRELIEELKRHGHTVIL